MSLEQLLQDVYGANWRGQMGRFGEGLPAFFSTFHAPTCHIFRAPGRVNLIGEHTDYNHGYVMPIALDKDVVLLAHPRPDNHIRLHNIEPEFPPLHFTIRPNIPAAPVGDWGNYARGVAQLMAQRLGQPLHGFDGLIVARAPFGVPRGAGLSSSSAFIVAVALALAQFNQWQPDQTTFAQLCAEAEGYAGTRGGIMDQFISVMGQKNHALFLDCRPDEHNQYRTEHIPLPTGYTLLIVNSGVKHSNTGGGYNQRVAACRAGVGVLRADYPHITHLRDVEEVAWEVLAEKMPAKISVAQLTKQGIALGDIPNITAETVLMVEKRCRHVWTENWRVRHAITALRAGDIPQLGRLMHAAHTSARDNYDISCPELEILVKLLNQTPGVLASRLTGAGWGGCVVALVENGAVNAVSQQVAIGYKNATNITPDIFACQPSGGAGYIGQI